MLIAVILAGGAALFFLIRWLLCRRNLKEAEMAIRQIRAGQTGNRLRLSAPDSRLEKLLAEINLLLDDCQKRELAHKQAEQQRRDEIANISHDLRTPLTSVIGYLQLMEQPGCTPEERAEYLSVCQSRAASLQTLLTGFYDLSRLEAGGYPLELQSVEPAGILYQLAADYYMDFMEAGMEPVLEIPEILPPILADPAAVSRVFQNLIQNTLRHGQSGSRLVIRSRQQDGLLFLSFSNVAPDLSQQDCARLFDRFYTADKMRTGKGTGLGLAIVRALCRKMDASVTASLRDQTLTIETGWRMVSSTSSQISQ